MNNLLSITSNAATQIKKIMTNAPEGMDSVVIGVDKSGCSSYSYKLDFRNSSDLKNYESIDHDGAKVLIDPKATMFLLGSMLDKKNIAIRTGHHCCQPLMKHFNVPGTSRISFGIYNTKEDVDHLVDSIDEITKILL